MANRYDVAAFIWPAYTGDEPRTRMFWPEGMGEWETVRKAGPKFEGHNWPRRPVWGYQNEADPRVMEMQIDAAADYGINVFIYDWYWYDRRPFLETCLNNGYLQARNNHRVKFYLMWANHHVNALWDLRLSHTGRENTIWLASVDRPEFERIAERLIEKYFTHPSYYTIDRKPVFMLYDLQNLMQGLGGIDATHDALAWFRQRAVAAGLPGLHLQVAGRRAGCNVSGIDGEKTTHDDVIQRLGFDSVTHYQYVHITDVQRTYDETMVDVVKEWERLDNGLSIPYFAHVSLGWDNNPRHKQFMPRILKENTPENIEKALRQAKTYADAHPKQVPLITVNSWNEWTEASYLQPDDLYGYGYLEAVKRVFGG